MTIDHSPGAGLQKSAILLASLGTDLAARVLSHMDDPHVEALIEEMTRLGHVQTTVRNEVLEEFGSRVEADPDGVTIGVEYARQVLERAVGPDKAEQFLGPRGIGEAAPPSLATILETPSPASLAARLATLIGPASSATSRPYFRMRQICPSLM